jgi:hypothetical protein
MSKMTVRSIKKSFLGLFFAVTLPIAIMFWIFFATFAGDWPAFEDWTQVKLWSAVLLATIAMMVYGILVSTIGVKKYMRRG